MAESEPRPVIPRPDAGLKGKPGEDSKRLSFEDAELFASRIRPSWELVDEVMREELAAELAAPAGSSRSPDTVIEGVPTFAIGDDSAPAVRIEGVPAVAVGSAIPVDTAAAAAMGEAPKPPAPKPVAAPAEPARAEAPKAEVPKGDARSPALAAPPRGAKTRAGVGEGPGPVTMGDSPKPRVAKTLPDPEPVVAKPAAKPAVAKPAAAKPAAAKPAAPVAASTSRSGEDDIEIPVTGASSGQMVKIALGLVAVLAVAGIGYGVFGRSGTKDAVATPATATATALVAGKAPPPLPATVPPPPDPAPKATQATASATVAPTATAAAKATAEPKAVDPRPEPKKTVAAQVPAPDKPAKPAGTPVKKGGGGIIRETPF